MQYYKNEDGTYKGVKLVSGIDDKGKEYDKVKIEYPRLKISKWKNDVEFSTPISIEVLSSMTIEPELVNIVIFDDNELLP